jgi:hypothetical protein
VTTFIVELTGPRTARIEADELTTRQDGSLWALVATKPKPAPLEPIAIFARGTWATVMAEGAAVEVTGEVLARPVAM